jgi:hypothetical protein
MVTVTTSTAERMVGVRGKVRKRGEREGKRDKGGERE